MNWDSFKIKKQYYTWSGFSSDGKKLEGMMQAISLNVVKIHLKQQGITPLIIRRKFFSFFNSQKISATDIVFLYRQLAALIQAGIPIVQSCDILLQNQKNLSFRLMIKTIKNNIEMGKNFVAGLRKFPHIFDAFTCHLIQVGEQTGTLDLMLTRAAHYKEKSLSLKNKIKQALLYPTIILCVALIISLSMLIFIVPRFAELFENFHGKLPVFTQAVLQLSQGIRQDYPYFILLIFSAIAFFQTYKKSPAYLRLLSQLSLKLPSIRYFMQKILCARFARMLATLISAGIPIVEALHMTKESSQHPLFLQALNSLQFNIASGQRIHQAMLRGQLFHPLMIHMVKVGEETGALDVMLEKVAEFYESEIDHWVNTFSQLLEPLIIIILGVLIGGLVFAMYLPIFKLGTVI